MPEHINELERLSKYYGITDVDKIKKFIEEHTEILDYSTEIAPLLNNYFPDYPKIIEFCEDSKTSDLDFLMIYIKGSVFDEDYKTLRKFKREALYRSKYSKNINGSVCVELW